MSVDYAQLLTNAVAEYFIFLTIDAFIRSALKNARGDSERKRLWRFEAACLCLAVLFIYYITDRLPLLLIVFAYISYTVGQGMSVIEGILEVCLFSLGLFQTVLGYFLFIWLTIWPLIQSCVVSWWLFFSSKIERVSSIMMRKKKDCAQEDFASAQNLFAEIKNDSVNGENFVEDDAIPRVASKTFSSDFPRIPLFSEEQRNHHLSFRYSATSNADSLNAMQSTSDRWPRGLTNQGNNLCFINTVFQCLSRIPCFRAELQRALYTTENVLTVRSRPERPVAIQVAKLLNELETGDGMTLSQTQFRLAASRLNCFLVSPPIIGSKQSQQDAAEFTMWLLATLHSAVNTYDGGCFYSKQEVPPSMSSVKSIFNTTERQQIEAKRQSFYDEISQADNLEDTTIYEPLKKLSDFEWEIYCMTNKSVIDQMFTGQSAELHQCLTCHRISVHIQTFTLLPVAVPVLASYTSFSLEDCLRAYDAVEQLDGNNSLKCDCSGSPEGNQKTHGRSSPRHNTLATPFTSPGTSSHATMGRTPVMSPIPMDSEILNASTCPETNRRTSTPLMTTGNFKEGCKRTILCRLPVCLIVQLMRFRYDRIRKQCNKIHTSVILHQNGLDLTPVALNARIKQLTDNSVFRYQLHGFCLHEGGENTTYGHYVAFVPDHGLWYKLEDEYVTRVSVEKQLNSREVQQNVYLVFYCLKKL